MAKQRNLPEGKLPLIDQCNGGHDRLSVRRAVRCQALVAAYFNQAHVKAFNDKPNSTGLMGLMRQPHATALLKAKGIQLQINRLTNASEAVKRGLTKQKVPQLTYKDCIKWCKALGVPTKKTKPEMVADLEKLFDGKPANHHINP